MALQKDHALWPDLKKPLSKYISLIIIKKWKFLNDLIIIIIRSHAKHMLDEVIRRGQNREGGQQGGNGGGYQNNGGNGGGYGGQNRR